MSNTANVKNFPAKIAFMSRLEASASSFLKKEYQPIRNVTTEIRGGQLVEIEQLYRQIRESVPKHRVLKEFLHRMVEDLSKGPELSEELRGHQYTGGLSDFEFATKLRADLRKNPYIDQIRETQKKFSVGIPLGINEAKLSREIPATFTKNHYKNIDRQELYEGRLGQKGDLWAPPPKPKSEITERHGISIPAIPLEIEEALVGREFEGEENLTKIKDHVPKLLTQSEKEGEAGLDALISIGVRIRKNSEERNDPKLKETSKLAFDAIGEVFRHYGNQLWNKEKLTPEDKVNINVFTFCEGAVRGVDSPKELRELAEDYKTGHLEAWRALAESFKVE